MDRLQRFRESVHETDGVLLDPWGIRDLAAD